MDNQVIPDEPLNPISNKMINCISDLPQKFTSYPDQ